MILSLKIIISPSQSYLSAWPEKRSCLPTDNSTATVPPTDSSTATVTPSGEGTTSPPAGVSDKFNEKTSPSTSTIINIMEERKFYIPIISVFFILLVAVLSYILRKRWTPHRHPVRAIKGYEGLGRAIKGYEGLGRAIKGYEGLGRAIKGYEGLGRAIKGYEGLGRAIKGYEGLGRAIKGYEGLGRAIKGYEGLGRAIKGYEGLGRAIKGYEGLGRAIKGYEGLGRAIKGYEGLGRAIKGYEGLGRAIKGYEGLGRAIKGYEGLGRAIKGYEGLGRAIKGYEGLGRAIKGYEGLGRAIKGYEGLGRAIKGYEGLGRAIKGYEGLGRAIKGYEGLGRAIKGYEGLGRAIKGYEGLGRAIKGYEGLGRAIKGYHGLRRTMKGNEALWRAIMSYQATLLMQNHWDPWEDENKPKIQHLQKVEMFVIETSKENIRRRRPTPATLFRVSENSPPEEESTTHQVRESSNGCTAYDVVINPEFFNKTKSSELVLEFLIAVSFEGLENKYDLQLCREWKILKNRKFLGSIADQNIRTKPRPGIQELESRPPLAPLFSISGRTGWSCLLVPPSITSTASFPSSSTRRAARLSITAEPE
ncbi:UNVERIFIED_CONTAM: hypothetical protein FKN15_041387 [Acipenser sinensis]